MIRASSHARTPGALPLVLGVIALVVGVGMVWRSSASAQSPSVEVSHSVHLGAGIQLVTYDGPTATVPRALGEAMPAIRAVWHHDDHSAVWTVWSRAIPAPRNSLQTLRRYQRYWIVAETETDWAFPSAGDTGSLSFVDVTEAAGLVYRQHERPEPGTCLLSGGAFGVAASCMPERMSGGAAVADVDGDGWPDLYVTRLAAPDILFRNRGDGTFADITEAAGLGALTWNTNGAWWGDIDNDGDPDLFLTTIAESRFLLLINDGFGHFQEEAAERGADVGDDSVRIGMSAAMGDFDRDGWLDIHTTEWRLASASATAMATATTTPSARGESVATHSRLLRNRGSGAPGFFQDVTRDAGVDIADVPSSSRSPRDGTFGFASAFADMDGDGWPELLIAADFGRSRLFWNNTDGTFTDGTLAAGVGTDENGMGSTIGDFDGDGDLDWFVSAIHKPIAGCLGGDSGWIPDGNCLYRNDGNRVFRDATDEVGVRDGFWGWGAVFFDADNDADLDLTMTNGFRLTAAEKDFNDDPMRYWENLRTGTMQERSSLVGLTSRREGKGLLSFDYDRDGDLDLFVVNNGDSPQLYRNDGGNAGAWLRVRVEGTVSNRDGVGARVELTVFPGGPPQLREVGVGSHFLGQSESVAHFGLGAWRGSVHRLVVTWPASGETVVLDGLPLDATILVREGEPGYVNVSAWSSERP